MSDFDRALSDFLDGPGERPTPPMSVLRERKRAHDRRRLAAGGAALCLAVGAVTVGASSFAASPGAREDRQTVAGPATPTATNRTSPQESAAPDDAGTQAFLDAVRTDASGRTLVAGYIGGACDGPARLEATERDEVVELTLRIARRPGDDGTTVCPAIGISRFVQAELAQSLGSRRVVSAGRTVSVFDGADLVLPGDDLSGFALAAEMGGPQAGSWSQTYTNSSPGEVTTACRAEQRSFSIQVGPQVQDSFNATYFIKEPSVDTRNGPASQFRQEGGPVRYFTLTVDDTPVAVTYGADCGGVRPALADAVAVLNSLRTP